MTVSPFNTNDDDGLSSALVAISSSSSSLVMAPVFRVRALGGGVNVVGE
jgi:hypothetical protein